MRRAYRWRQIAEWKALGVLPEVAARVREKIDTVLAVLCVTELSGVAIQYRLAGTIVSAARRLLVSEGMTIYSFIGGLY